MNIVQNFIDFSLNEEKIGSFYNDMLNPKFWDKYTTKNDATKWVFDPMVRKKLVRIANDFFEKYADILGDLEIDDIQLTGSIANYTYTNSSDLDIHVLVDLSRIKSDKDVLKAATNGIRFVWNLRHDVKIRGHEVELYLQDSNEPHVSSGLYSLKENKWIKNPKFDPPDVDEQDINKKAEGIISDINKLESKLVLVSDLPKDAKELYKRLHRVKEKIQKMRNEGLSKEGEGSVGNLAFKKLRNEGYIEKIIDLASKAYSRIYSE